MQIRKLAATGVLVGATSITLGLGSPAAAVCDPYSAACPTPPQEPQPSGIGSPDPEPPPRDPRPPTSLPFSGGEIALLTAVGVGALAGGTALVVAGRRKSSGAA